MKLTTQQIRRLNISKQRLTKPQPAATKAGLLDTIRSLGCLQLDPIRAVERTQYLVLWSRLGNYDRDLLHQVQFGDRMLFEFWAHAASIVLTEHYPLFKRTMHDSFGGGNAYNKRANVWLKQNETFRQYVRDEIHRLGAVESTDLEDRALTQWVSGGWSSGKNTTQMLEFMWSLGELAVSERNGLRKKWTLMDDWLPAWAPREDLTDYEQTRRAVDVSIKALGVASAVQIRRHFMRGNYPALTQVLDDMVAEKKLLAVDTEADFKGQWYMHADDEPLLDAIVDGDWQPRTVLLSPFDNLICDRARTEMLWDFYYRIEIYVPAAKRQYGYYVLPILRGDRLIGRIAPRLDRKSGVLSINGVYAEPHASKSKATTRAIRTQLHRLAKWIGAKEIVFNSSRPQDWDLA